MKRVVILLLFLTFILFPATDVNKLKTKAQTIDKNIKKNQENITVAKKKESETSRQITILDAEIKELKENYYEIEERLQKAKLNLQYTEKNIVFINQEISSSNRYFSETIAKYNDYLFTSKKSFFLEDYDMNAYFDIENMKSIFGNVVTTLDNINTVKKDVSATRVKISNEKTQVESLMAELAAKQKEIEAVKVEKDRLVEKLKKDQVSYGNEISKLKKEKAALEKQIVAIIKAQTKAKTKPKTKVKKTTVTVKKKDPKTGKITTTKEVKTENVVVQENYSTSEIIKNVGYLSRPVDGSVKYNFGQMKSGEVSSSAMEIKAKLGQRISAAGDGEVIFAGSLTNLGNVVIINHGYGLTSTYGNLISVYVGKGTNVKKGQQIGVLGLSSDREPVLYFETRISSKAVDPRTFLN